ncbi:MAG: AAA family ATPase [Ignisphaera sp.]
MLLLAGLPGSGKTVFSEIAKSIGVPVITLGDIIREEVTKRGLEPSLENILSVAQELRERYGREAIAILASNKISESLKHNCLVVVDGIRSLEEINYIKSLTNAEILVVAVHASPKVRFARLLARGRTGDPKTWDEFVKRDLRELSWGLGNVVALADEVIVNESSIEEFKSKVRDFLYKVMARWCT